MDQVPSQPTSDMLSVLVVDDDRELRETLSLFLRDCGCYVTAAAGGVEGLQAVILDAFDVVVTDIELHGSEWFWRSEEHTSELQSQSNLVCRLLLEKKKQ